MPYQIKTFQRENLNELEEDINAWLKENQVEVMFVNQSVVDYRYTGEYDHNWNEYYTTITITYKANKK